MFSYCCSKSNIDNALEKDVDNIKIRIEEMTKQLNNIYELLEALTSESKKTSFYLDKDNLTKINV